MKFLLVAVNAKYIHSNPALYSIRSYINRYKNELMDDTKIVEYTINNRQEQLLRFIYEEKPDVVAFSCYIWNINEIEDLLPELNKVLPDIPIWLGGPEVTYHPHILLKKHKMLTGIMIGEGEETVSELIEAYKYNRPFEEVKGIIFNKDKTNKLIMTAPRDLLDLSNIPFLYDNIEQFKNRIIYYESSRGCPYKCNYCLSSIDKTVRFRNLDMVFTELKYFLDHKVPQVKFIDRTFNCNRDHATKIWEFILENDNGITNFHFEIASESINDEEIELVSRMRPGLAQFEIGVQSINIDTIREIQRLMSIDRLKEVVRRLQAARNIHLHLDLIVGLPYEDYDSFVNSFNEVYSMKPDQLQLGFLKVLKGSPMEENAGKYELKYLSKAPYEVLSTKWISYEDILRLKQVEEMVELYYNSGQFTKTIELLIEEFESPFQLYSMLARFYENKGYFIMQPSRMYKYEVLLEFIEGIYKGDILKYKESLTYDIYTRENIKSRPTFAPDISVYKDRIREFYKDEAQNNNYLKNHIGYDATQLSRMTHMEVFTYGRERFILFDYMAKDVLSGNASVFELSL